MKEINEVGGKGGIQCQAAIFLAVMADIIISLYMETNKMVRRGRNRHGLSRQNCHKLLVWGHSKLIDKLAIKCHNVAHNTCYNKLKPTILQVQPKAYTSKTCG